MQGRIQDMQSRRNVASKEIGMRKGKGEDADDLIAEVVEIKAMMPGLEEEEVRCRIWRRCCWSFRTF